MLSRFLVTTVFVISLAMTPARQAQADRNDAIAVLVLGGLIGAAVLNENKKRRQQEATRQPTPQTASTPKASAPRKKRAPVISPAQRAENRAIQDGLNYFGYDAGTVDGIVGRNTRSAIRRFEEAMGYQADGRLSAEERDFLVESRERANAAQYDPEYREILARQGPEGVLRQFRNEDLGIVPPAAAQMTAEIPEARQPEQSTEGKMPSFVAGDLARSVNQLCNEVNILTMANGGLVAPGSVNDRDFALKEQFCLARAHAISEGNKLMASMTDEDQSRVVEQCEGLADYMAPVMQSVAFSSATDAQRVIQARVVESGQTKGQLITAGRICLGSGYRLDSPQISLSAAAVLIVSGLPAYGEIIGHHLREGLGGLSPDRARADEWLNSTLAGLGRGDTSVLGQMPDRAAVMADALSDNAIAINTTPTESKLPVFRVNGSD